MRGMGDRGRKEERGRGKGKRDGFRQGSRWGKQGRGGGGEKGGGEAGAPQAHLLKRQEGERRVGMGAKRAGGAQTT